MNETFENRLKLALAVDVKPETRQAVRERVMAGAETVLAGRRAGEPGAGRAIIGSWRPLRLAALAAAVLLLLLSATALAARNAGPDSFLYPVEQRMENVRTFLAWQSMDRARVEVGYANRRLDEIEDMAGRGQLQYLPGLIENYHRLIDNAAAKVDEAAADGQDTSELDAMIAASRARYDDIIRSLGNRAPQDYRQGGGGNGATSPGNGMTAPMQGPGVGQAPGGTGDDMGGMQSQPGGGQTGGGEGTGGMQSPSSGGSGSGSGSSQSSGGDMQSSQGGYGMQSGMSGSGSGADMSGAGGGGHR